ncbi:MAG: glycine betaine ABC transporter substrate-binding protein [Microthrixaceae bacterium]
MKASFRWLAAILLPLALVAAACGSDDGDDSSDSGDSGDSSSSGALADIDMSGLDVTVGSKDFTEQFVLGEILVQALEATGATVTNEVNLGGTSVNREALLAGEIDMYWEYNGTGWTVHLAQEDPSDDPDTLTEAVREMDLAENSIQWVGQAPFNNTYGFATGPALTEENGGPFDLQGMADYLKENPDAQVCMETEFPNRPDGLVLFTDATGYEIPEGQQQILDTNVIYTETAQGGCSFGEIFTTDGRIPALDLSIVDDGGAFILYNVSLNVRDETYQEAPDQFDALVPLLVDPLDEATMAELNRQVSVDGEDAADVAKQYLQDQGLT